MVRHLNVNTAKRYTTALLLGLSMTWAGSSMADTESYAKPGAPVRISAPEHSAVAVGETAQLKFAISSQIKGHAELHIRADEGLEYDLPESMDIDLSKGSVELPVQLKAMTQGRYYLYLSVNMNGFSRNVVYGQTFGDEKAVRALRKPTQAPQNGIKRFKGKETIYQK